MGGKEFVVRVWGSSRSQSKSLNISISEKILIKTLPGNQGRKNDWQFLGSPLCGHTPAVFQSLDHSVQELYSQERANYLSTLGHIQSLCPGEDGTSCLRVPPRLSLIGKEYFVKVVSIYCSFNVHHNT